MPGPWLRVLLLDGAVRDGGYHDACPLVEEDDENVEVVETTTRNDVFRKPEKMQNTMARLSFQVDATMESSVAWPRIVALGPPGPLHSCSSRGNQEGQQECM